jgi:D-alanine-D-alanine ligase
MDEEFNEKLKEEAEEDSSELEDEEEYGEEEEEDDQIEEDEEEEDEEYEEEEDDGFEDEEEYDEDDDEPIEKSRVLVLFNQLEEKDAYSVLRGYDPASLNFKPNYNIHVATEQEEYDAVVSALNAEGFEASCINLKDDHKKLNRLIVEDPPDVVFNLVELFNADQGLEGCVAGFFDLFEVPYTGAPPFCLFLCRQKALTKKILLQNGVATAPFRYLEEPVIEPSHGLHYPLIVKPSLEDGSTGVEAASVVYDYSQLLHRIDRLYAEFDSPVLVEEFLEGKELHVSVLGNDPPKVLPIEEFCFEDLDKSHPPLITYDIKWNPLSPAYHNVHTFCPADIDEETEELVTELALKAYAVTFCRDYARIDVRLGRDGKPYVLEVNPNPDLTEGVSFMESAEEAGLTFSKTLRKIVKYALKRA